MTLPEYIANGISLLALFVSFLAFADVRRIKRSAQANIEWYINERITNTKEEVSRITVLMIPLLSKATPTPDELNMIKSYEKLYNLAIENNLNAYEGACANYNDNKVDKVRFKKLYISEIRELVENKTLKKYFDGVSSKYKAILKVYGKWENIEK